MQYDLEDRTTEFGKNIIILCRSIKEDTITKPIINQLIRSATSIGANYREANHASSKKDFKNKIRISQKEANETKHWIQILATAFPQIKNRLRKLWQEAHELTLIFASISKSCDKKV